jgi:hypothetical protein
MSETVHSVSTKITPNLRKNIIRALHFGPKVLAANLYCSRRYPDNDQYPGVNAQTANSNSDC